MVVFTWPSDPDMQSAGSWLITQVMSDFERNYTHAEVHMHASIQNLVLVAELLRTWCLKPSIGSFKHHMTWKAHSMGCYLLVTFACAAHCAMDNSSYVPCLRACS